MQRPLTLILLAIALIATFLIYQTGLSGTFIFDDIANISSNSNIAVQSLEINVLKNAVHSSASGPFGRPISMLSFALNYYETGFDPFFFKLTNLILHLLNGVGIFVLSTLILNFYRKRFQPELPVAYPSWISLAITTAWLLHPLNLTNVLYVVQRMNMLSAFFAIWGLALFFWGRVRLYEGKAGIALILTSLLAFTPLAALSKENGLLLPLLMLITEFSLFTFHITKPSTRRFLIVFYILSVALPLVVILAYIATHAEWLSTAFNNRNFNLLERLMTEARVLWFYLRQIVLPNTAQMGLYLDDIAISRSLFQPMTTIFSIAGIVGIVGLAFTIRKKSPLVTFGILFFFAGHLLESTIIPLDIAYEHRNYLPMFGILLPVFYYLLTPLKNLDYRSLRQSITFLFITVLALSTYSRATTWSNPMDFAQAEVRHHPNSVRANIELAHNYSNIISTDPAMMENYYLLSSKYYQNAANLDQNDCSALLGLITTSARNDKPLNPQWLQTLTYRLEHAPYVAITSDKLVDLVKCQLNGGCKLANSEVENIIEAALSNPGLYGSNKVKVLYMQSAYLINVKHDYDAALEVMRKMIEIAPEELSSRMALVNFLVALHRIDQAQVEIFKIHQLDSNKKYAVELADIEKQIAKTEAQ